MDDDGCAAEREEVEEREVEGWRGWVEDDVCDDDSDESSGSGRQVG
jgi:hypothetical protein